MKLEIIRLTSLKCQFCDHYIYETNIRNYSVISYKCTNCGRWYYRCADNSVVQLILNYTHCFGTHGSQESQDEVCPLCLQPAFKSRRNDSFCEKHNTYAVIRWCITHGCFHPICCWDDEKCEEFKTKKPFISI